MKRRGWSLLGRKSKKKAQKAEIKPIETAEQLVRASLQLFGRVLQEPSTEADEKVMIEELQDAAPELLRIIHEQVVICQEMADATFREALHLKGQIMGLRDLHREAKRIGSELGKKIIPLPERGGDDEEEDPTTR